MTSQPYIPTHPPSPLLGYTTCTTTTLPHGMGISSSKHDHPTHRPTKPNHGRNPPHMASHRGPSSRGTGSRKLEAPRSGRVAKCRGCPQHPWFFIIFFSVNRLVFYLEGEMLVGIGFQGMDRVIFMGS